MAAASADQKATRIGMSDGLKRRDAPRGKTVFAKKKYSMGVTPFILFPIGNVVCKLR